MDIPGGVTATVRRVGGDTDVQIEDEVEGRRVADPDLASVRSARTHAHPLMGPSATRPRSDMSDLEYPAGLRYTAEHEWVRVDGDTVRVGITSFAQEALGDVVYVSLPGGRRRRRRRATRAARSSRPSRSATSTRRSPARSRAVNAALDATPELVNSDPYGEGWMYELRVVRRGASWTACMDVEAYTAAALLTSLGSDAPAKGGPTTVP